MHTRKALSAIGLALLACLTSPIAQAQKSKSAATKVSADAQLPLYKQASAPLEARIAHLLSLMTVEEKAAQMQCLWQQKVGILNAKGAFDPQMAGPILRNGMGQIARPSEVRGSVSKSQGVAETVELANTIQRYMLTQTRLGIPVMFHEESLHGNQAKDATNFPTPLALASSWNPDLMTELYTAVAKEVRYRGGHQVLAPVVDLLQEPRWGRSEETLGEDPYLISTLAKAQIKAYQGDNYLLGPDKVAATLKHFGVHGRSEGGINVAPSLVDELTMRQYFFPSFKACVEAGVMSVMPCYNEVSGLPAHANVRLLQDILRREWGFKGTVVSDYEAIKDIQRLHHLADDKDTASAALLAFQAGVDVETPDRYAYLYIPKLVKERKISQTDLDSTVARILRTKFRLGLFENPYLDVKKAVATIGSTEHRAIAKKAALESITLLKNEGSTLPLNLSKYKKIAIIGPNADACVLGGYSNVPKQLVTPLAAIKEKLMGKAEVLYAEGCRITDKGDWFEDVVVLTSSADNAPRIKQALDIARQADYIVLCLGGNAATSREAWAANHSGDLTTLDLLGDQNKLVQELNTLGKPMAAFVFNGPPTSFKYLSETVPALVNCFYLGQETGAAVADVLVGEYNPGGKLPVSIARSAGNLPAYYNYKASSRRNYHFDTPAALYPFGFGLSYTQFSISAPQLDRKTLRVQDLGKDKVTLTVTVKNTGSVAGTEVVQLYIRDKVSSVTRPYKELKAFERIVLKPGESRNVTFSIGREQLAMYNAAMQWVVEPGDFDLLVGNNSSVEQGPTLTVVN